MRSINFHLVRKTTLLLCIVLIFGMSSSWNAKAIGSIVDALKKKTDEPVITPEPTPFPDLIWVKNEYTNGDAYEGYFNAKTGMVEGFGTYRWANGDLYEGMWKDNFTSGFGIFRYGDGDSYEGMFKGDLYTGMFKDGDKSGFGIYIGGVNENYFISAGEWRENRLNGNIRVHWRDHSIRWGLYENNAPVDGMTIIEKQYEDWNGFKENLALDDGSLYTGEYNTNGGDFVEGYGMMTYPDGSMYIGKFKEGFERDTSASGIFVSPDHAATEYKGSPDEYARIMPKPNP